MWLGHLAGSSCEDFQCWHKGGEAITSSGLFFGWIENFLKKISFHLQTFFIKLVELCWCAAKPGLSALDLSLPHGLSWDWLWAFLWEAETQNAWGFQASSLGSTLAAKWQVVLLSSHPFWLFSFIAPYLSYEKKGWEIPLSLGSWHWNPSVVFLKECGIFNLFPVMRKFEISITLFRTFTYFT